MVEFSAVFAALGTLLLLLLGLVLKRLSEIDGKLDRHIAESVHVRGDVQVLKDRWERKGKED